MTPKRKAAGASEWSTEYQALVAKRLAGEATELDLARILELELADDAHWAEADAAMKAALAEHKQNWSQSVAALNAELAALITELKARNG